MGMERALAAGAAKNIHTTTTRSISTTTTSTSTSTSPSSPSSSSAEPESTSPTEAPSKPATSSALAYIPAPLPADLAAKPDLTLHPIHPWDLTSPVPISNCQPLFYDAATQEYYLFTCDGAVLLHKTAPLTIRKRLARKFLYDWPSVDDDAVAMLASRLKIGKSEWPALVSDHVVVYHAVHDSVIVKRNSGNSGLFRFCVDKVVKIGNPGLLLQDVYTRVVRPDFGCVLSCECPKVYYFGKTVYCPACTSYRTPLCINMDNLTPKAPHVVGKITMPIPIARIILYRCVEPGTTKLSIPRAYKALSKCFSMHDVSKIPLEDGELVANLLRDCLFVDIVASTSRSATGSSAKSGRKEKGATAKVEVKVHRVCWASYFNIPDNEIPRGRCQRRLSGEEHENAHRENVAGRVAVAA